MMVMINGRGDGYADIGKNDDHHIDYGKSCCANNNGNVNSKAMMMTMVKITITVGSMMIKLIILTLFAVIIV